MISEKKPDPEMLRERDVVAAALSALLPGAGHLYKGRYLVGALLILLGIPVVVWTGILLSLATAGLGLLVPVLFWAATAVNAYCATDLRKHHMMGVI